jgi:site-specific DNA-methyltransferase (adenine-specific)
MNKRGYMPPSQSVEWGTPQELFDTLNEEFDFTIDVAASDKNAKCERYYTKEQDGLKHSWSNERVFMNPPYGYGLKFWVKKAFDEIHALTNGAELVTAILPSSTDVSWFHDYIYGIAEIRFIRGRVKFENSENGKSGSSTKGTMIVIWRK